MSRHVLRFLSADNLLVWFHLQWLLTSLKLKLAAAKVKKLEIKPGIQHLC